VLLFFPFRFYPFTDCATGYCQAGTCQSCARPSDCSPGSICDWTAGNCIDIWNDFPPTCASDQYDCSLDCLNNDNSCKDCVYKDEGKCVDTFFRLYEYCSAPNGYTFEQCRDAALQTTKSIGFEYDSDALSCNVLMPAGMIGSAGCPSWAVSSAFNPPGSKSSGDGPILFGDTLSGAGTPGTHCFQRRFSLGPRIGRCVDSVGNGYEYCIPPIGYPWWMCQCMALDTPGSVGFEYNYQVAACVVLVKAGTIASSGCPYWSALQGVLPGTGPVSSSTGEPNWGCFEQTCDVIPHGSDPPTPVPTDKPTY